MEVLLHVVIVNASLARITVEVMMFATNFAGTALETMPLVLARIVVVEEADVAEVETERHAALLARLGWSLDGCTIVTGYLLDFLRIEIVWHPRRIIITILADLLLDSLDLGYLGGCCAV